MTILAEVAQLVNERLGNNLETLTIERLVIGLFFTGVKLSNGAGGLCFTPVKEIPEAVCCPSSAGRIFNPEKTRGLNVKEALASLSSREPLKVAVAVAALNALSLECFSRGQEDKYKLRMGVDALDAIKMPKQACVAVVGAIIPVLHRLKKRGGIWWVIEQDQRTLKENEMPHFIPFDRSEKVISKADVLIITGATIVSQTIEDLLKWAKTDAEIAIVGPTASMLPKPFFDRGVGLMGGVWVKNADALLEILASGGSGYHFLDTHADRFVIEKR